MSSRRHFFNLNNGNYLLANTIAYYPLVSNSNDVISGLNGTDTSMSYSDGGDFQNMADFRGSTSAKIVLPDNDVFSIGDGSTDSEFSISYRLVYSALGGMTISKQSTSATNQEWLIYLVTGNISYRARVFDNSAGKYKEGTITLNPVINTVYWVVFTFDGTNINFYIDGSPLATTTTTQTGYVASENLSEDVTVGKNPVNTSGSLNGYLGELIFFNKVLDTDDIAYIKNKYDNNLPFN